MQASLEGPNEKLARARHHLDSLTRDLNKFMETNPYSIIKEVDAKDGARIWRMKVNSEPPISLGVVVGDVIHNFRSSLDHLAWQLALLTTNTPHEGTEFPIYKDGGPGQNCFYPRGVKKILSLPQHAQKLIEAIQPYKARNPKDSPLWLLQKISNIDKHRLVVSFVAARSNIIIPFNPSGRGVDMRGLVRVGRMVCHDGDELLRISGEGVRYLDEKDDPEISVHVAIDVPELRSWFLIDMLQRVYYAVAYFVFPKFESFFTCLGPGY